MPIVIAGAARCEKDCSFSMPLNSIRAFCLSSLLVYAQAAFAQSYDPLRQSSQQGTYGNGSENEQRSVNGSASVVSQSARTPGATPTIDPYAPDQIDPQPFGASGDARSQDRSSSLDSVPDSDDQGFDRVPVRRAGVPAMRVRSQRKPSEFELFVSDRAGRPIRRFGAELLVPLPGQFTAPPTTAIPSDYRINPGDELVFGVTGAVQASNIRLVVDQDGRVFIPRVGAVRVGGVAYRDLQGAIASQVSRQYRDFQVSVAIGRLHGITVYVTGFAATPGSYTVSSLSTVVNAVLAAGGPSDGGSFRSIQVRRSGRLVSDFDLYDFLLKGDKHNDIVLQNGDVIFIAPAGTQVAVLGSVNKEAIYEAAAADTLNDVLLYAGGANTVADLSRLYLLDPMDQNGWQELSPEQALTATARRGEVLRVISSVGIVQPSQRLQSLVTISGEVQKPGRYFVKPGTTLEQVVALAGGMTPQAYAYGAVFVRDSLRRQQQMNLDKAVDEVKVALTAEPLVSAYARQGDVVSRLATVNSLINQLRERRIDGRLVLQNAPNETSFTGGFTVENNDELFVPPQPLSVGVYGMVNSSANFRYAPGLRVRDYLRLAGGFTRIADKKHTFVLRANGTVLGRARALSAQALPGDTIFVPVDSERGALWAKIRDLAGIGFQGALAAASISSLSN